MEQQYAIACDMTALSPSERRQHGDLLSKLIASLRKRIELPDGYEFVLDSATPIADVGAWIALETRCCPFLAIALMAGPGPSVTLRLTGPEGAKEFLVAELGLIGDS